jgi:hypothetical protein
MMMQVAEKFNFRIDTSLIFLEGYKVADEMKKSRLALLHLQIGGLINLK